MNSLFEGLNTSGKIRALMATRNISQIDLAALLDCTDETVRNWLKADRWDKNDLIKIADKFDINVHDLI